MASIPEKPFGIVKIVIVSSSCSSCVSRFVHLSHFKKTLLTAIRASFGKKLRAQKEPKSLPPDAFPGLPKLLLGDPAGGAYSAPPDQASWLD